MNTKLSLQGQFFTGVNTKLSLQGELLGVSSQMWQKLIRGATLRVAVFIEVGCRGCSEGAIDEKNSGLVRRRL